MWLAILGQRGENILAATRPIRERFFQCLEPFFALQQIREKQAKTTEEPTPESGIPKILCIKTSPVYLDLKT